MRSQKLWFAAALLILNHWLLFAVNADTESDRSKALMVVELPKNELQAVTPLARSNSAGLFVGVNEFTKDSSLASLNCAVNDAVSQAYLFVEELKLIPANNCILCLSGQPTLPVAVEQLRRLKAAGAELKNAAKSDILNGLIIATRMPVSGEDLVIVSVSSHGFEDDNSIYIMPSDGLRAYLSDTALRSKILTDTISESRAGKKMVILDACRERVGRSKSGGAGPAMSEAFMKAFAAGRGQITLTSCGIGQLSYEDPDSGYGVFTHFLLQGLRGQAKADEGGFVTVGTLNQYVADGVRRWIVRNKPSVAWEHIPQPRLDASENARRMPLAIAVGLSGEDLEKARQYWRDFQIEAQSSSSGTGQSGVFIDLKALWEMYLDEELGLEDYQFAEAMVKARQEAADYLDDKDREISAAIAGVANGSQPARRLSRMLDAIEEKTKRIQRPQKIIVRQKIDRLLILARAKDNKTDGREALKALDELLKLEPGHLEALSLYKKIAGYYGPEPGDLMTNRIGMKLVWIGPGEFMMGSHNGKGNVKPVHQVKITKGFWLGQYEVTQAQYEKVMGTNPSSFKGDNNPVESVSWEDAMAFCKKLGELEGKTYTLPTEAQWEYACRAGTKTDYSFGDSVSQLGNYAWYDDNSGGKTHPVGQKQSNGWGLYDMHGNVWEWCLDWYDENYYSKSPASDPIGPTSGARRVLRGGSWNNGEISCRTANRYWIIPVCRDLGFRVLCVGGLD